VDLVPTLVGDGYTPDEIVQEYPELEREDVHQAARYGAWLANERRSAVCMRFIGDELRTTCHSGERVRYRDHAEERPSRFPV